MDAREDDPDRESNPYEAPRAALGPLDPRAMAPAGHKKAFAITHDLTDQELRRFVNFDVYHDPKPMLGLVPQWVAIALMAAAAGALGGLTAVGSSRAIAFGGLTSPVVVLMMLDVAAAVRRRHARALGLCEGRTVTVTPWGPSVQVPGARRTSMIAIGPEVRAWCEIRLVSISEDDLTFWMRPTPADLEGRARVIVPLRAFADRAEAAAFGNAARYWHAAATGGDPHWWDEADR
jgi:hypothetical protein